MVRHQPVGWNGHTDPVGGVSRRNDSWPAPTLCTTATHTHTQPHTPYCTPCHCSRASLHVRRVDRVNELHEQRARRCWVITVTTRPCTRALRLRASAWVRHHRLCHWRRSQPSRVGHHSPPLTGAANNARRSRDDTGRRVGGGALAITTAAATSRGRVQVQWLWVGGRQLGWAQRRPTLARDADVWWRAWPAITTVRRRPLASRLLPLSRVSRASESASPRPRPRTPA